MMARLLGNHSRVFAFNELHFFEEHYATNEAEVTLDRDAAAKLLAQLFSKQIDGYHVWAGADKWQERATKLVDAHTDEQLTKPKIFQLFLDELTSDAGKEIPVEQTPRNLLLLDTILTLWPNARIIEMERDPRDVMLSQKNRWRRIYLAKDRHGFGMSFRAWTNYHPLLTPRIWRNSIRTGHRFMDSPAVMRVVFENLIRDPAKELAKVLAHLELGFEASLYDVGDQGSSSAKDSGKQGFNENAVGRWQQGGLSDTELALCETICADEMRELGYKSSNSNSTVLGTASTWLSLPIKLGLAGFSNLGRSSNMLASFLQRVTDSGQNSGSDRK